MSKKTEGKQINMNQPKQEMSKKEINRRTDLGLSISLDRIIKLRADLRTHREKISNILGIIEYSKFYEKANRLKGVNSVNTVAGTMNELMIARGALGEVLKRLIPAPELMAYAYWKKHLKKSDDELFSNMSDDEINRLIASMVEHLPENLKENVPYEKVKTDFLSEFCNPYKYPKQSVEDIEPVIDDVDLKTLNLSLPEGIYQGEKGENLQKASELNDVQLVDFIKSSIKIQAEKLLLSIPPSITGQHFRVYEKYDVAGPFNTKFIILTHLQGAYKNLIDAKNLFGHTYQIF